MVHAEKGRIVTPSELDEFGLLAEVATVAQTVELVRECSGWPSYEFALTRAPMRADDSGKDESRADARWITSAFLHYGKRNYGEIAAMLSQVSSHAKNHRTKDYEKLSVDEVAKWLREQRGVNC